MLHSHTRSKDQNASNTMDCINQKTIMNSVSVAKPMRRQTYLIWKQKRVNHVCTHLNAPTVEATTKQTPICVHFGNIGSIMNGTSRNIIRSVKTDPNSIYSTANDTTQWFVIS